MYVARRLQLASRRRLLYIARQPDAFYGSKISKSLKVKLCAPREGAQGGTGVAAGS